MSDPSGTEMENEAVDRFAKERRYKDLSLEKKAKAKRIKEIGAEMETLGAKLLEQWEVEGVKNLPLDGQLLYLQKDGYVKLKQRDPEGSDEHNAEVKAAAIAALKSAGYELYVKEDYNSKTVSSLAREEHWDVEMPPELEEHFDFDPHYKIAVKKQTS